MSRKKQETESPDKLERRLLCEASLPEFINFVHPRRLLGNIHREVLHWWTRPEARRHQLLLLPRDHMKSALLAYRLVWHLTTDPTKRILLISANSNLATKQLKFIKDILTSDNYRLLWPEMVEREEAYREKWTEREISVDHPRRKEESIRDPSIFTAGLTTNIVGLHCDICGLDDPVVSNNAYSDEGREKTLAQYGHLSSVESGNALEIAAGTRYHPNDLYSTLIGMTLDSYDDFGTVVDRVPLYEVFERQVESVGDGSGQFLWPRQQRSDGTWFGFDKDILAVKRSQYTNQTYYRAQYYNDPHDVDSSSIKRNMFQYYDQGHLVRRDTKWYFKGARINVFAAVDFAYSLGKRSDYTSIAVIGVDGQNNYYVLEVDRFKTDRMKEYFDRILKLHEHWGFRKLRAEVTGAQQAIVTDLKESYIRPLGIALAVEEYRPMKGMGAKEERIRSILEPKYANLQMWHYRSGNCQVLEEELMFTNPQHDDVKDSVAMAVDLAQAPSNLFSYKKANVPNFNYHPRWGGVY